MLDVVHYTFSDTPQRKAEKRQQNLSLRRTAHELYKHRIALQLELRPRKLQGVFHQRLTQAKEAVEYSQLLLRERQMNALKSESNGNLTTLNFNPVRGRSVTNLFAGGSRATSAGTFRRGATSTSRTRVPEQTAKVSLDILDRYFPLAAQQTQRLHSRGRSRILLLKPGLNTFRI